MPLPNGTQERRAGSASALLLTTAAALRARHRVTVSRLLLVQLSNLITDLWKRGGGGGRIMTPWCVPAGAGTHCLPGPPQGTCPHTPCTGIPATAAGQFIGQILRIIKDNLYFRCLTKKVRYSLCQKSGSPLIAGTCFSEQITLKTPI